MDAEGAGVNSRDSSGDGFCLVFGWARGATEHSAQQPTLRRKAAALISCQLDCIPGQQGWGGRYGGKEEGGVADEWMEVQRTDVVFLGQSMAEVETMSLARINQNLS